MGSNIVRKNRSINKDGTTHINLTTPTLTIGGTRDGIVRITRIAESYYHQVENIEASAKGKFPIVLLKNAAHHSFMNGTPSKGIQSNDLSTTLS